MIPLLVRTRLRTTQLPDYFDNPVRWITGNCPPPPVDFCDICLHHHMVCRWQFALHTEEQLCAMGFTPPMFDWLRLARIDVNLLADGCSQLLDAPLAGTSPNGFEDDNVAWLHRATFAQLITYRRAYYTGAHFMDYLQAKIVKILEPTAFRIGMRADEIFVTSP